LLLTGVGDGAGALVGLGLSLGVGAGLGIGALTGRWIEVVRIQAVPLLGQSSLHPHKNPAEQQPQLFVSDSLSAQVFTL
jgi:hypothetical protein